MTTLEAQHEAITNLILENQKLKRERDELRVARNECERQFQEKVAENIALLDERDETREALRRAKRFVEAFEPRSRGAEIDQNETLNIISKVLDLLYGGDSLL